MKKQSRTKGIMISYVVTIVRAVSQLLLTTVYLKKLGYEEYGFYQYVYAIASYAIILDFGISSVVNKFTIEYREKEDQRGVENALFLCLVMTIISVGIITLVGVGIFSFSAQIFGNISAAQLVLARKILCIIILYIIVLLFQHYFEGILLSNEQYVTLRCISLAQIFIKIIFVLCLLYSDIGSLAIAISDLSATLLCLLVSICYSLINLKIRIKYYFFDKEIVVAMVKLASSLCLQSVILYINTSIDKYLIGRLLDSVAVTIYTLALNFSSFFDEIPSVIQRLYLPQAVKLVANNADGEELTDFVIKPGRFQFILCGGMLAGFVLFGKQFIILWAGSDAVTAWIIALLLMAASLLPLIQNVCLAILTAKNKRMFRSYVLAIVALANFVLTVYLVKQVGLMGAPIGTFIALVVGNNVIMNWYYKTKIGINIRRLFKSIFKGILPCIIMTSILCSGLLFVDILNISWFVLECFIFIIIYAICLWMFGLNEEEKKSIMKRMKVKN